MNIHDSRASRPHGAKPNGANPDRSIHPGSGRRRTREFQKGRQVGRAVARGGARAPRRSLATGRPPDRASASAAGPLRLPARPPSGGAGDRDAAGAGRGLRGRLVLRPFRHRHGRRACAPAPHGARLRQPHLRIDGSARSSWQELPGALGRDVRVVRAPCMGGCHNAPVAAIGHALHEHATVDSVTPRRRKRRHASARARTIPTSIATAPPAATSCSLPASTARGRSRTSSRRSRIPTCAASAAPDSRPGASGASCAPSRLRG